MKIIDLFIKNILFMGMLFFSQISFASGSYNLENIGVGSWTVDYKAELLSNKDINLSKWKEAPWLYNQPPLEMKDTDYFNIYSVAYRYIYSRLLQPDLYPSYLQCVKNFLPVIDTLIDQENKKIASINTQSELLKQQQTILKTKEQRVPLAASNCIFMFTTDLMYGLSIPNISSEFNRSATMVVAYEELSLGQILRVVHAIKTKEILPSYYRMSGSRISASLDIWAKDIIKKNPLVSPVRMTVAFNRMRDPVSYIASFVIKDNFLSTVDQISDSSTLLDTKSKNVLKHMEVDLHQASFDCKKASADIDKMICSNKMISHLDGVLSTTYRDRRDIPSFGVDKKIFRDDQIAWIKKRNTCLNSECLIKTYIERIENLCLMGVASGVRPNGPCDELLN